MLQPPREEIDGITVPLCRASTEALREEMLQPCKEELDDIIVPLCRASTEALREQMLQPPREEIDVITVPVCRASTEALREQLDSELQAKQNAYRAETLNQSSECGPQFQSQACDMSAMPLVNVFLRPCVEPFPGLPWSEPAEALGLQQFHNMANSPE